MSGRSPSHVRKRHVAALRRMLAWKEEHLQDGTVSDRSTPYLLGEIAALKHAIALIEKEGQT